MTKLLHISSKLTLPADAVTSTIVIYGGKGMGKTNLAGVLVEEFASTGQRFAVIDPMGVWWGLRHSIDGKGNGIKVLILGGTHGHLPISPESGALVADLVVDDDANIIVDISRRLDGSMWAVSERIRFVRDYAKRLYQRQGEKRRPLNQVIDEAARFAPQIVRQGELEVAACMGAIAVLVEEGRNVGIGVTLVTQRSARLNKDVAELADCMIAFRIVGPNSMRAVLDWLGEHVEKSRLKEMSDGLRSLPRGSALVVSPGWLEFEGIVAMRKRTTFDSSATPETGKELRVVGTGAKIDVEKYRDRFAQLIQQQAANDPKTLKARVAELEKQLLKGAPSTKSETKTIEHAVVKDAQIKRIETLIGRGEQLRDKVAEIVAEFGMETKSLKDALALASRPIPLASKPIAVTPRTAPAAIGGRRNRTSFNVAIADVRANERSDDLSNAELKILEACAWAHSIGLSAPDAEVVAFLAGYTVSGHFNNLRGKLHTAGLIDYPGAGTLRLTEAGKSAAPEVTRPVTTEELHRAVMERLDSAKRRLLQPLIEAWPEVLSSEALAAVAGFTVSGHFNNLRGRLRTMGLITYPSAGTVRAADLLFPEQMS